MHFHLPTIALFSAAALLTFSYAHVASLKPRADVGNSPVSRSVCSSRPGRSTLIRLRRAMPLPRDPEFQNNLDTFMYNRTLVADNVVTISSRSTAVHRPLGCTKVNWAVKDMCGCSSLIAVSEKAMYFTHYFKNLAFSSTKSGAFRFPG